MSTTVKRALTIRHLDETMRRRAEEARWHPGERCFCGIAADPAIVGGDGFWYDLCLTCRRSTR